MQIKKSRRLMFSLFLKMAKLLQGKHIGTLPLVGRLFKFLFVHLRPTEIDIIEVEGNGMYVNRGNMDETFNYEVFLVCDSYNKLMRELFKKEIKPGMIVVDIGAYLGYYTLLAAKLVGEKGKVVAFEPAPDNYALLTKNITLNGYKNIIPMQKAVSNESRQIQLFLNDHNPSLNSIYMHNYPKVSIATIDSITLDDFFKEDLHVDFIKMDIEGAEMAALEGMTELLGKNRNLKIVMEFKPEFLRNSGSSPEEFLSKLAEYGFELHNINKRERAIQPCDVTSLLKAYGEGDTNLFCMRKD